MARTATLTLTAGEIATLFGLLDVTVGEGTFRVDLTKGERRVFNSLLAKTTAALIATQKEVGS